jgi:hypothetical protein
VLSVGVKGIGVVVDERVAAALESVRFDLEIVGR